MKNNAIGKLKYDITAGALSLVVEPLAGTSFGLPDQPTDATGVTTGGTPTFGRPIERLIVADRLDMSQAKYEIMLATTRVAEAGGAFTYSLIAGGRGAEGTVAQAWTASQTVYVFQIPTAGMFEQLASGYTMRTQSMISHNQPGLMSWDGTSFKFSNFRALGQGRGLHGSSVGWINIAMPANGTTATGVGGAANVVVASGGFPLVSATSLYYEPNIGGDLSVTTAGNFRVVGYSADYVVPAHWILVATYPDNVATDKSLRVTNGVSLVPWRAIGAGGEPAFSNAWVSFGAPYYDAAFRKSADGMIDVRGAIKTGTIGLAAFTLAAGFRPANTVRFAVESNGAYGCVEISNAGVVTPQVGSNTRVNLDGIRFLAEA